MIALRAAAGLFAALFVYAAAVQYNDPDPLAWMAIYGLAAVASALGAAGRAPLALAGGLAVVALIWASTLAPRAVPYLLSGRPLFDRIEMTGDLAQEEAREMLGLVLVSAWCAVLAWWAKRG